MSSNKRKRSGPPSATDIEESETATKRARYASNVPYVIMPTCFGKSPSQTSDDRWMLKEQDAATHWFSLMLCEYADKGSISSDVVPHYLRKHLKELGRLQKACEMPVQKLVERLDKYNRVTSESGRHEDKLSSHFTLCGMDISANLENKNRSNENSIFDKRLIWMKHEVVGVHGINVDVAIEEDWSSILGFIEMKDPKVTNTEDVFKCQIAQYALRSILCRKFQDAPLDSQLENPIAVDPEFLYPIVVVLASSEAASLSILLPLDYDEIKYFQETPDKTRSVRYSTQQKLFLLTVPIMYIHEKNYFGGLQRLYETLILAVSIIRETKIQIKVPKPMPDLEFIERLSNDLLKVKDASGRIWIWKKYWYREKEEGDPDDRRQIPNQEFFDSFGQRIQQLITGKKELDEEEKKKHMYCEWTVLDFAKNCKILKYPWYEWEGKELHYPESELQWCNFLRVIVQLHGMDYVHGDILLRNVIFPKDDPWPILIDFDFCRKVAGDSKPKYCKGYNCKLFGRHPDLKGSENAVYHMDKIHDNYAVAAFTKELFGIGDDELPLTFTQFKDERNNRRSRKRIYKEINLEELQNRLLTERSTLTSSEELHSKVRETMKGITGNQKKKEENESKSKSKRSKKSRCRSSSSVSNSNPSQEE